METTSMTMTLLNISHEWRQVTKPDLLSLASPHWLQFPPPSCVQHHIIAIIYCFIVVPGIIGNLLMIITFLTTSLRNHANLMSLNLAMADLLMNLEIPFLIKNSFDCGPKNFSSSACQVYGFVGGLSGTVAIVSITAMAYQRFLKITRPFNEGNLVNSRNSTIIASICWMYGFVFAIFPILSNFTSYTPEGYLTSCSFDYLSSNTYNKIYIIVFGIAAYVVPLTLIIFFYARITQEVHKANRIVIELHRAASLNRKEFLSCSTHASSSLKSVVPSPTGTTSSIVHEHKSRRQVRGNRASRQEQMIIHSKMAMEKRLLKSVILLIACWTIAWTPYALVSLAGVCSFSSLISPLTSMMPALLAKCASVVDPYIYFYSHPHYRQEAILVLTRACQWYRNKVFRVDLSMSRLTTFNFRDRMDARTSDH